MDQLDSGRIVVMLTAAYPAYPLNDMTTKLYVDGLVEAVADPAVGFAVVQDWITTRVVFPTIAELLEECRLEASRRDRRAAAIRAGQRQPGDPDSISCTACGDDKWEHHEYAPDSAEVAMYRNSGSDYTPTYDLPCRVCQPVMHEDFRDGHNRLEHNVDICEWPLCQQRAKKRTRKGERTGRRVADSIATEPQRERADVGPGF